jgi:hypothetical protein
MVRVGVTSRCMKEGTRERINESLCSINIHVLIHDILHIGQWNLNFMIFNLT